MATQSELAHIADTTQRYSNYTLQYEASRMLLSYIDPITGRLFTCGQADVATNQAVQSLAASNSLRHSTFVKDIAKVISEVLDSRSANLPL